MCKIYLNKILLWLLVFLLPICGNWLFLLNNGELLSVEKIVEEQIFSNNDLVVGLATRNQGYYYKKEMYSKLKPKILILGSSRVMEFRQHSFNLPVFNAGGAMNSINEGYSFIKEAFSKSLPEVIIIGLDYWWFNEIAHPPSRTIKPPPKLSHRISLRTYLLPYQWLWNKKLTAKQYFQGLNPMLIFHGFKQGIGVDAIINHTGFCRDGSYQSAKTLNGTQKNIDEKFSTCINNMKTGALRFEYGQKVNDIHIENFLQMLEYIKSMNVKIILIIPPNAPTIVSKMAEFKNEYAFIDDLRSKLRAHTSFHDFHDPAILHTSDCEFFDGIHGGEITYVKILNYLAMHEPLLSPYLNVKYNQYISENFHNLARVPLKNRFFLIEKDFLKIGCDKTDQYHLEKIQLAENIFRSTVLF